MNKEQILKIIDDLTKNNKKLRVKDLTNDEAIFVHFGAVKFLCDFETGPLKVIFQFARPVDTFFEKDFEEFGKLKEKSIVKGHLYDHIEFWTIPETEEEFKTLLQKVLDNYS
jgi:hypothetical protein